jgi:ABC-type antimicrobial peptide transport system permease subunit
VRHALAQVNPDLAVIDFMSFAEQVKENFTQQAMIAKLTSLFGMLALVLASVGLYGVTAYSVERRTSEIGIRMALGADRINVLRLVLRGAFLQVGIGLAIGIPATILGGRAMAAQLFGVKPYDPNILLLTTFVLSFAALIAAVVPARRAATLDPMRALRTE